MSYYFKTEAKTTLNEPNDKSLIPKINRTVQEKDQKFQVRIEKSARTTKFLAVHPKL